MELPTFSIIGFTGGGILSVPIALFSLSPFRHVGMIITQTDLPLNEKWQSRSEPGTLYLLESTLFQHVPDLVTGEPIAGVSVVPLRARLQTKRKIFCRTPSFARHTNLPWRIDILRATLRKIHGVPYEKHPIELFGAVADVTNLYRGVTHERFCSELIAFVLQRCFIAKPNVQANEVSPADFFWKWYHLRKFKKVHQFGPLHLYAPFGYNEPFVLKELDLT